MGAPEFPKYTGRKGCAFLGLQKYTVRKVWALLGFPDREKKLRPGQTKKKNFFWGGGATGNVKSLRPGATGTRPGPLRPGQTKKKNLLHIILDHVRSCQISSDPVRSCDRSCQIMTDHVLSASALCATAHEGVSDYCKCSLLLYFCLRIALVRV